MTKTTARKFSVIKFKHQMSNDFQFAATEHFMQNRRCGIDLDSDSFMMWCMGQEL